MKFEYPEIEVVKFAVEDIITASSTTGGNGGPNGGGNSNETDIS